MDTRIKELANRYHQATGLYPAIVARDGRVIWGESHCVCGPDDAGCQSARALAVSETARWGEPFVHLCPGSRLMWAVPLMVNDRITGGIVVDGVPMDETASVLLGMAVPKAARLLQELAEQANLTNAAYLELKRRDSERESRRAEAIHELKGRAYDSIREIYLREEAGLMAAVKRGDRGEARHILNRVLVGIYFFGRARSDLLKSFILELVVSMSRSAVEAGGEPAELLGSNFTRLADLSRIETEEELTRWLVSMLEHIMDAIREHKKYPSSVLLNAAIAYMEEHLSEDISRDDVAAVACVSPSHFSRVVKETFGRSFTEVLTTLRIDRAKELLLRSERSLVQICTECGFNDQSYFTKVFSRYTGCTPGEFRQRMRRSLR